MTPKVKENLKIIREKQKVVYNGLSSIIECYNKIIQERRTMYNSELRREMASMRDNLKEMMGKLEVAVDEDHI